MFRRELGFGPIVNWFEPAPVLSAMMFPPPIYPKQRKRVANYVLHRIVSVGFCGPEEYRTGNTFTQSTLCYCCF